MTSRKPPKSSLLSDAKKDLFLTITKKDIKQAIPQSNDSCAAANAICRQEGYKEVRVYKTKTYIKLLNGHWLRYITPKDLYIEIMIFDRGGKMLEGNYRLTAPKGVQRLGQQLKPTGPKRTARLPTTPHYLTNVRENAPKGPAQFKVFDP